MITNEEIEKKLQTLERHFWEKRFPNKDSNVRMVSEQEWLNEELFELLSYLIRQQFITEESLSEIYQKIDS